MLIPALAIVDTLALVGVAAAIGRKFFMTRDRGLLWLFVALVVWPVAQLGMFFAYSSWVDTVPQIGSLSTGEIASAALYTLDLIQRSLLIVAILMLYRRTTALRPKNEISDFPLDPSLTPSRYQRG